MFSGPFMERGEFSALKKMGGRNVQIEQFSPDFLAYLAAADLSISMGGYNTTMNILATGVPALVWPFPQNREQRLRAGRLAKEGILKVIEDEDLRPGLNRKSIKRRTSNVQCRTFNVDSLRSVINLN